MSGTKCKGINCEARNGVGHSKECLEEHDRITSGVKYDQDKPLMYLIHPNMEMQLATCLSFGAVKYGPENWRELDDLKNRYISAAMRHINAIRRGEDYDEETGLLHAAHAVACLMFLGEHHIETENPWKRAPLEQTEG